MIHIDMLSAAAAATQGFDVEAATRAYLDTLRGAARAKSDAYFEGGYWLILWDMIVTVVSMWVMLRFGWSSAWRSRAERITSRRWLQPAIYAVPFAIVSALIVLPWTIYKGFIREKQYDLMNQSFGGWLTDQAIALVISVIVTAILLTVVFAVIRAAPKRWWLWGTGAMIVFTLFGALIAPVFISPLFNHYTPMKPGPIRAEILAMARANHIPADNVYVFDASKQSKRISANVSGLGPTIRISLNDSLLNRSTPAEIKAVMGHEMGHYALGHVWKGIAFFAAVFLIGFFLLWWLTPRILARHGQRWGVRDVADPAVVPLFAIIFTVYFFVLTPVLNTFGRTMEAEADAFGLNAAREPDGFASVAMKLSEYRKIEPGPIEEFVFFDHPSGANRVRRSMQWKADHLDQVRSAAPATPPAPPAG